MFTGQANLTEIGQAKQVHLRGEGMPLSKVLLLSPGVCEAIWEAGWLFSSWSFMLSFLREPLLPSVASGMVRGDSRGIRDGLAISAALPSLCTLDIRFQTIEYAFSDNSGRRRCNMLDEKAQTK